MQKLTPKELEYIRQALRCQNEYELADPKETMRIFDKLKKLNSNVKG